MAFGHLTIYVRQMGPKDPFDSKQIKTRDAHEANQNTPF